MCLLSFIVTLSLSLNLILRKDLSVEDCLSSVMDDSRTKRNKKKCTKCQKEVVNLNRHLTKCLGMKTSYRKVMPEVVEAEAERRQGKV